MKAYIECFCEKIIDENKMFSFHFIECPIIQNKFKDLDNKISRSIKKYVDNLNVSNEEGKINGLLLLKLFLKKYISIVKEIIDKIKKENNLTPKQASDEMQTLTNNINEDNRKNNKYNNEIRTNNFDLKNRMMIIKSNSFHICNQRFRNNLNKNDNKFNNVKTINNFNGINNINNLNDVDNMNLSNNISENFQNFNFQYNDHNLKRIKSSINFFPEQLKLEKEITLTFLFLNNYEKKVKAKLGELFCDVFLRSKEKIRRSELKYYSCFADKVEEMIKFDKTLYENGIQEDEIIQVVEIEKNDKEEKEEEENEEEKDEKSKLFEVWTKEYKNGIENNLNFGIGPIHFLFKKYKELGMNIKEHEHKVIYCKTNYNWYCNECFAEWSKTEPRLFCSICDYNMCSNCRKSKKYYKIGNIPSSSLPSNKIILFINYSAHEHRLAYCRTKRSSDEKIDWFCNKCKEKFNEKIWAFYCTQCDFNLCSNCALNKNIS